VRTAITHELADSAAGRKWVPQARTYDFVPPDLAVRLMIFLASGKADALTGRYLHISDDANELVRRAEEIQRDDLYAVRLRK
jgi:hypothetical protein